MTKYPQVIWHCVDIATDRHAVRPYRTDVANDCGNRAWNGACRVQALGHGGCPWKRLKRAVCSRLSMEVSAAGPE